MQSVFWNENLLPDYDITSFWIYEFKHWDHAPKTVMNLRATLREKCPYLEFFRSVFSLNAGKYRPEKLQIRTLFMQCKLSPLTTLLDSATVSSGTITLPLKTCERYSYMLLLPLVFNAQKWSSRLKFSLINVNKSVRNLCTFTIETINRKPIYLCCGTYRA